MGGIRFRTLHDLDKMDAHVGIRCGNPKCDRYVVYQRQGIISLFQAKGWNPTLEVAGARFRCERCGHRGAEVRAVKLNERKPIERPKVLWER